MTIETATRRVAIYLRVSSDDQAERGTIQTQADEVRRRLDREPGVVVAGEYADDGVSGTIPLAERPWGRRLMRDAAAHLFGEVHVYKLDRLGRDLVASRSLAARSTRSGSGSSAHLKVSQMRSCLISSRRSRPTSGASS